MTRQQPNKASKRLKGVKDRLKEKGWSNRAAAKEAGVTFEHLSRVLNGHRESQRLLSKIEDLPIKNEEVIS